MSGLSDLALLDLEQGIKDIVKVAHGKGDGVVGPLAVLEYIEAKATKLAALFVTAQAKVAAKPGRKLGSTQQHVLDSLREHGSWGGPGTSWIWSTVGETTRLMDSLVDAGYATAGIEVSGKVSRKVYRFVAFYQVYGTALRAAGGKADRVHETTGADGARWWHVRGGK